MYFKLKINPNLLIFVDEIFAIPRDCTNGVWIAITAQGLGTPHVLSSTTVAQFLHDRINIGLKDLRQLETN